MTPDSFNDIVKAEAAPALQADWDRQRDTALEFALRFAAGSDTQLLGDQVGMGKTYVAMGVMAHVLGAVPDARRVLLVTPPSAVLRAKWEQDLRRFSTDYLRRPGGLRPLAVRNFWDLIANLGERRPPRGKIHITDERFLCILHSLWLWADRKGWLKSGQWKWAPIRDFDWNAPAALAFTSDFSMAAWEQYLEHANASDNNQLYRMLRHDGAITRHPAQAHREIRRLFRAFAQRQHAFEPNVLLLGMNALLPPRQINNPERRRFAAFVLTVLLKGAHEKTRKTLLAELRGAGILDAGLRLKALDALRGVDLYGSAAAVSEALQGEALSGTWSRIRQATVRGDDIARKDIVAFFNDMLERVVSIKLGQAGVALAVIDEVHNWKGGGHGAVAFQRNFAPVIPRKLLLSATPFQLAEGEMQTLFGYASLPGQHTAGIVDRLHAPGGPVARCVERHRDFVRALEAMPAQHLQPLDALRETSADAALALDAWLAEQLADPATPAATAALCRAARDYRAAVEDVVAQQQQVMIRHTRDRRHRSFHAGADFGRTPTPQRHALYGAAGLADPRHELLGYLAIRLDQHLRQQALSTDSAQARAHLVRGLSSSNAAFRASSQAFRTQLPAAESDLARYLALLGEALETHAHPKVQLTVEHALAAHRAGRKTLIFCERVATVHEIAGQIRRHIDASSGVPDTQVKALREKLLDEHLFVDVHLHASWRRAHGLAQRPVDAGLRAQAGAFALRVLRDSAIAPTPRRVLRLLDLWLLRAEWHAAAHPQHATALALLAGLADDLDAGADAQTVAALLGWRGGQAASPAQIERTVAEVQQACAEPATGLWDAATPQAADFDHALWGLLDSEALQIVGDRAIDDVPPRSREAFHAVVMAVETGLRRIALRPDHIRHGLQHAAAQPLGQAVRARLHQQAEGGTRPWERLLRFMATLQAANGSLNPIDHTHTLRRSLWRGVDLDDDTVVATLDGSVSAERRITLCAAFNSPLAPDVLVCTSIGSEGIDLHRECAEVIHHDLSWNPAKLEQRTGRIDRVGRLGEPHGLLRVGVPFLAQDYEQEQYRRVLGRAQRFEVLLGQPDFDTDVEEEVLDDTEAGQVREADAATGPETAGPAPALLPEVLADWLRVDLSLAAIRARAAAADARAA